MKTIEISTGKIGVYTGGKGTPIVFIHGFPLDHRMWCHQIEKFESSHRVIAPDLRGFGQNAELDQSVSMAEHARDIGELLDRLELDEPVVLCGLSMGGYIAFEFLRQFPNRIAKLILSHTRAAADTEEVARGRRIAAQSIVADGAKPFIRDLTNRLLGAETKTLNPEVVDLVSDMANNVPTSSLAYTLLALAQRNDFSDLLAAIAIPTLVIAGSQDSITPSDEMRLMAAHIPECQFDVINKCGHLSPLENPAEFNRIVTSFVGNDGEVGSIVA